MMVSFIFVLILLLPTHIGAQPTPQVCYTPIYVGNNIASPTIPAQSGHGAGQSIIVYDTTYTIPCTCGLLTGWQLVRYDNYVDGCKAYSCHATLMVYRNLNVTAMTATLVGYYNVTQIETYPMTSNYIVINLPQANWIPIKYGDYLGWEGSPSPVTYYEESTCSGTCPSGLVSSSKHFYGSVKSPLTAGGKIGFFNGPSNGYANWRYFGFRAIVWAGTPPYFTTLPQTLNLDDTTAIGTVVWTVKATDDETNQTLTLTVEWGCPSTSYFYMDPATGDVTVNRSLVGAPVLHTLAIEASDDCFTSTAYLSINVISTLTTTALNTTTLNTTLPPQTSSFSPVVSTTAVKKAPSVLSSPVGASLLAITILGSLVAVGSSIGMCVLGSYMSDLTKELGEIPPLVKSQAIPNNEKNPWRGEDTPLKNGRLPKNNNNQKHGDFVNRRQNHLESNVRAGTSTPITHGASSPIFSRLTPVEQLSKSSLSPRASPRNYPPRDMLYW